MQSGSNMYSALIICTSRRHITLIIFEVFFFKAEVVLFRVFINRKKSLLKYMYIINIKVLLRLEVHVFMCGNNATPTWTSSL